MSYFCLIKCGMKHPGDFSELKNLIQSGEVKPSEIVTVLAQTEGDNYARLHATLGYQLVMSESLGISREEVAERVPMMIIGKTGGLLSPHYSLFIRSENPSYKSVPESKRFAFGISKTRVLAKEEIGTLEQSKLVIEAVREAMKAAGIENPEDVQCVEIKCPWGAGGARSKGASALGAAVAMNEMAWGSFDEKTIMGNPDVYSLKASVTAAPEQLDCSIIVMGNSARSSSTMYIGSGMMEDTFDLAGLADAFRSAGLKADPLLSEADKKRIVNLFVNAGADATGSIRGRRHTIHSDSLAAQAGSVAKAVVNAVIGSWTGDSMFLVSAGFEHQGPLGASLIAVVVDAES
jgi:cyanuric acid amidohydrolase